MKTIRIGGGQGFWGDSPDAAINQVKDGNLNYLACDYLAELTLSIMQRQKLKNPNAGYARDFISLMSEIAKEAKEKDITVISNAGGMNVLACVNALKDVIKKQGIKNYRIGYVLGDDIHHKVEGLMLDGEEFRSIDTDETMHPIVKDIVNVNAYYGYEAIEACLKLDVDVIITGRATDSALFLAPLAHEFGYKNTDWDKQAQGIMVGHMLECGGQASGGNYDYGWQDVENMENLGFPIAEITEDKFFITKTETSGGLITEQSLKEQILYEVHDPANYITPDVVVDISEVTLKEVGKDRVEVANIKGKPRPDTLKLSVGYHAGYKVVTHLAFAWPDAVKKAQKAAEIIFNKMEKKNLVYQEKQIDYLGLNSLHLDVSNTSEEMIENQNEVVLRIALRTQSIDEAKKIIPEIAPLQLNGPPGSSFFGGRSRPTEVIALWPTFIHRKYVELTQHVEEVN